ncbi:MAG: metal ABC transporter permease [Gammaproteobacteria bacterium]|nr:metal ABC transporter permease [Gammaproteobacteria bacterium]
MNIELLNWSILGPAIVAGLLVLSTHVPLGQEVLKRGIIFIDLAIAQIAGLGVLAAGVLGWEDHMWAVQLSAVSAALVASAGLHWTEKRWPQSQEPLIGILFVLAATGSILLLAENPHGAQHLKDLLVGQILWSTWQSLMHVSWLYIVLLTIWFKWHDQIGHRGFYVIFAFAVTASVQLVGVYLVFASLIIPTLATRRLHGTRRLMSGYLLGAMAYVTGILLSALFDLPTGAMTVWTMAFLAVIVGSWIGQKNRM